MFYSHQLLARKAPRSNMVIYVCLLSICLCAFFCYRSRFRRNLDKLNIIKICEEILNLSVPMALRFSGILMGGVVIVYERKVKLLYDLIVETGPTQTQKRPIVDQQIDQITDSIRTQLKMHFETPGSTEVVSLNQLADGMNRKRAACLFYQTCVLATRGFARVKQEVAYGDILISRRAKIWKICNSLPNTETSNNRELFGFRFNRSTDPAQRGIMVKH